MSNKNIVLCYLTENEYYFTDNNTLFSYFKAKQEFSYGAYHKNYILLIRLLEELKAFDVKNFMLYNNTRLVEEICCQIKPLNDWGGRALIFISRNLLVYFVDFNFKKLSQEDLDQHILEGKELIDKHEEK